MELEVYVDSDFAGSTDRKPMSGGMRSSLSLPRIGSEKLKRIIRLRRRLTWLWKRSSPHSPGSRSMFSFAWVVSWCHSRSFSLQTFRS